MAITPHSNHSLIKRINDDDDDNHPVFLAHTSAASVLENCFINQLTA